MEFARWYVVIGGLLTLLVFTGVWVKRLPLTTAMLYLGVGWVLGIAGWLNLDPLEDTVWLERLSEIAVIISLFSAGLKLRVPFHVWLWRLPVALAFGSMTITVGLIAWVVWAWLYLPLGAAVILGAVLAPTDPVLASDVQVERPQDVDRVRFTLTSEAGMNDGTAFPLVMLGLGLLGLHELGWGGWRWWGVDVVWAISGGCALGTLLGRLVGRFVVYLRSQHHEAVGLDEFLALGLIALTYGFSHLAQVYGFLAVFAAGLALRKIERDFSGDLPHARVETIDMSQEEMASHPQFAPAFMAAAVLHFNEQMERIGELALVLICGALLVHWEMTLQAIGFTALLFCVIRPLATMPLALASGMNGKQTALIGWFGIRGIGSMYYLFYALNQGVPVEIARSIVSLTLCVIMLSILVHGISATPLMRFYEQKREV